MVRTGLPEVLGDLAPHLDPVRELEHVHAVLLLPLELVAEGERRQGADGQAHRLMLF